LGRQESPEKAHALLLKIGHWQDTTNPYPARFGLSTEPNRVALPALPEEERLDLTHLTAFAIDDEGNQDPDDAICLDGERLWVHVADVAALVRPETTLDLEARSRGATLYLPERTIPMLTPDAVQLLGLGLSDVSPALSFGLTIGNQGEVSDVEVTRSWVRVTRISYAQAQQRLTEAPFARLWDLAKAFREQRRANGAVEIRLPEVSVRVVDGEVNIRSLPALESRTLVTEMMLMAGQAAARFALEHGIPFPFSTQAAAETESLRPSDLAGMFALRKHLKRSQIKSMPAPHAGLGLEVYSQITSPLRRYLDLLAHQQLRAFICGEATLPEQDIMMRIGAAETITGKIRSAERSSNRHWTLVYLRRHPQWHGAGIVMERRGPRAALIIPELGLDATVSASPGDEPNAQIRLAVEGTDLATLSAYFRPLDR
jgi:exoribonuclease-2